MRHVLEWVGELLLAEGELSSRPDLGVLFLKKKKKLEVSLSLSLSLILSLVFSLCVQNLEAESVILGRGWLWCIGCGMMIMMGTSKPWQGLCRV